jgi:hypothetical protein
MTRGAKDHDVGARNLTARRRVERLRGVRQMGGHPVGISITCVITAFGLRRLGAKLPGHVERRRLSCARRSCRGPPVGPTRAGSQSSAAGAQRIRRAPARSAKNHLDVGDAKIRAQGQ